MTVTNQLCGGPAEGQILELHGRPIQWRVAVARPYPRFWELDNDPSRLLDPFDVVLYLDTNIRTQEGHILYATTGLFEQLRRTVRRRMEAYGNSTEFPLSQEPGLGHSNEQVSGNERPSWSLPARMSGKGEYPLDAIKREDTERLIAQIDEVTDAGA